MSTQVIWTLVGIVYLTTPLVLLTILFDAYARTNDGASVFDYWRESGDVSWLELIWALFLMVLAWPMTVLVLGRELKRNRR